MDRSVQWVETGSSIEHSLRAARASKFFLAIAVSVVFGWMLTPPWAVLNIGALAIERARDKQKVQEMINDWRIKMTMVEK